MLTPSSWLQQLWKKLSIHHITLSKFNSAIPCPCEGDVALMDALLDAKVICREETECSNRCWLYLQVFFLSDIVSGNGKMLLLEAYNGKQLPDWSSKWKWPRQSHPPKSHWKLWDIAVKEVFIKSETRVLRRPLGNWTASSHQRHKFVYNVYDSTILETHTNGTISEYTKVQGHTRQSNFYMHALHIHSMPCEFVPVTVSKPFQRIIYGKPHIEDIRNVNDTNDGTWQSYLHNLQPAIKYLLRYVSLPNNGLDVARAIRARRAISVSDDSVMKIRNSAAISWMITDKS